MDSIPQIQINQLCTIVNSIYKINNEPTLDSDDDLTNDEIVLAIIGQSAMKGIGQKSHTTRSTLKKEAGWDGWLAAEKKQLDNMHKCQMYGNPIRPPKHATILQSL
eukprot:15327553-Ditylum_brightwellii.AAC.1